MLRYGLWALVLAASLSSCKNSQSPEPTPVPPAAVPADRPQPQPWAEARTLKVAMATPAPDRHERLELRHEPQPDLALAHLKLVLVVAEGERTLVDEKVPLADRDTLWAARWMLVAETPPSLRRAVSWDGGASYTAVLTLADGTVIFCPHKKVPGSNSLPDWPLMLTAERWATGLFETAVWGCDEAQSACKSRSLAGMSVHHGEPGTSPLVVTHQAEMHAAVANLESLKPDRLLVSGLLEASVIYQPGLTAAELEKLGRQAARMVGPDGPLTEDERKALRLRVIAARNELKQAPKDQLSPRTSVEALSAGLKGLSDSVSAGK